MPRPKQKPKPKYAAKDFIRTALLFGVMILFFLILLTLAFSSPVAPVTDQQVWDTLVSHGYTPTDNTEAIDAANPGVSTQKNISYRETDGERETLRIEFLTFGDTRSAMICFRSLCSDLDGIHRDYLTQSVATSGNPANVAYYILKAGGKYYYLFRVDNTVLYAYGDEANKDIINQIASELGYVDD